MLEQEQEHKLEQKQESQKQESEQVLEQVQVQEPQPGASAGAGARAGGRAGDIMPRAPPYWDKRCRYNVIRHDLRHWYMSHDSVHYIIMIS